MTSLGDEPGTLLDDVEVPATIDHDSLSALFSAITGLAQDDPAAGICEDAFLAAIEQSPVPLELRPGGWRVDVAATAVRTALSAAIMTAVLWAGGFDQIPTFVLPAVLPLLVAAQRVELSGKQKYLLAELHRSVGSAQGLAVHPDVLYNKLPQHIRDQLSPLDFRDFLDAFIGAGIADNPGGGDVRLRPANDPSWIRIQFS
jgi:hypothetical protein